MDQRTVDILESITDEFASFDREWRYTYFNERALEIIRRGKGEDLTREDLLGKSIWEIYPEAMGSVSYQKFHEAMREQKPVHFEAYSPWSDRWFEVHAYPTEEGLSVYSQDITQRKEAEEQRAYHAYLLENIHDAVIATDEQLVVTAWNKGAKEMYGWSADEVLGRNLWEAVPSDLSEEQRAEALKELEERGSLRIEALSYAKDGTPVYVEGITIALRGGAGADHRLREHQPRRLRAQGGRGSAHRIEEANRGHPRERHRRLLRRGSRVALHLHKRAGVAPSAMG
jgi:PAS domain S-box-containing protein